MANQYLITGSDTVTARQKYNEIKKTFTGGSNFVEIDLSSVSPLELAEKLQLNDMFGQTVFVFVNFALTKNILWDEIDKNLGTKPVIFEAVGKNIGRIPKEIKKKLQISVVDGRTEIFNLINTLSPKVGVSFLNLLKRNINDTPEPVVMVMIQNRIRDLIIVSTSPYSYKGQSWQKSLLISQAESFSLSQLIKLYRKLLSIEIKEKNSQNPDSVSQHFAVELFSI